MGGTGAAARARRWLRGGSLTAASLLALAAPAAAAPELVKVGDFASPTFATGDAARVFVVEQAGRVQVVRDGGVGTFLDLRPMVASGGERGLLSMALAGDRAYVYLTAREPPGALQIWEYRVAGDTADAASGRLLLSIPHADASNHNGGQLQLGPDGKLWLATGDGGADPASAQDPGSLLGKLIRLDPATGAVEVLARGLRNPWRFSFDRATGQIVIADVGASEIEEVNLGLAANYGWPCFEGSARRQSLPGCDTGAATPVLEKSHLEGYSAITGGYVVRDPGLPTLLGRYLYGDIARPEIRAADLYGSGGDVPSGLSVPSLSSFGEDACGRLFAVSLRGPVYRIVDGAPSPCAVAGPPPLPPPAPPPAADTRACAVSARVRGLRSVRRLRRVTLTLRTDEACRARVSGRIRGVAGLRTVRRSLVPGRRAVVRLRLTPRGTRALRRALARRSSVRLALRVRAVDAAGNVRTLRRAARVRG